MTRLRNEALHNEILNVAGNALFATVFFTCSDQFDGETNDLIGKIAMVFLLVIVLVRCVQKCKFIPTGEEENTLMRHPDESYAKAISIGSSIGKATAVVFVLTNSVAKTYTDIFSPLFSAAFILLGLSQGVQSITDVFKGSGVSKTLIITMMAAASSLKAGVAATKEQSSICSGMLLGGVGCYAILTFLSGRKCYRTYRESKVYNRLALN